GQVPTPRGHPTKGGPPVARAAKLYPPSPVDVPDDLAVPSGRYRLQVILVLASLLLFAALYMGLVAGSGYLTYLAVMYPIERVNLATSLLKIALSAAAVLLFLFLLKGLFKRSREEKALQIEIVEEDHPDFFALLRGLCTEIHAPFPRHVYVSPEVNACVFYNR